MGSGALRRVQAWVPVAACFALFAAQSVLARGGGGEHYHSGASPHSGGGHGGDGLGLELVVQLIWFCVVHPALGIPTLLVAGGVYFIWQRSMSPEATTQKAFERQEAEVRTAVDGRDVVGWVNALQLKDPTFELTGLMAKVQTLFLAVQNAWLAGDLRPARPFLSDAVFQRFTVQLELMEAQGLRNVFVDMEVLDLGLMGLDQSAWFDTVRVRVRAQARDVDVPTSLSPSEAQAAARQAPLEPFIEVWSFVRKPGARTHVGGGLAQGKCPNCGAPFDGGATNVCGYCKAVVNSGNYDWTLTEITQGVEATRGYKLVDGLLEARATDPALNLEMLEDRASLIFWKWIQAQSRNEPRALSKLANPSCLGSLEAELAALRDQGRRKVFRECALGAVNTRLFRVHQEGVDEAHVEMKWSAKLAVLSGTSNAASSPSLPQRTMFVLIRQGGATTQTGSGMSTFRCPVCHAPLSDSLLPTCDYCQAVLSAGGQDWILSQALSFEAWSAAQDRRFEAVSQEAARPLALAEDIVVDPHERERILYLMAGMAMADGVLENSERRLLKLCSARWNIPWARVELALDAGPELFERLVRKGSPEAGTVLTCLVKMALVDGRIDRKERQMLTSAAEHLGLREQLGDFIRAQQPRS